MSEARIEKLTRWLPWLVIVVSLFAIILDTLSVAAVSQVWDDAYMSFRYANALLAHGVLAWNGSVPTFGFTSIAQIFVILPFAAFWDNPTAAAATVSILEMLLFFCTIPFFVPSIIPRSEKTLRRLCIAVSFALITLGYADFSLLAASGMETMLALAFMMVYLAIMLRSARRLAEFSTVRLFLLGLLGGSAFLVRPDLMLFTVMLPLSLALWFPDGRSRKNAWVILLWTALTLAALLGILWAYFGTPLPLSFYAKGSSHVYGPTTIAIQKFQPILQLIRYLDDYKILVVICVAFVAVRWRLLFRRGEHALVVGMIVAVLAFTAYYLFFVIQFMGYSGRFYYPTLPILLCISCMTLAYVFRRFSGPEAERVRRYVTIGICVVLLALLYTPLFWGIEEAGYAFQERAEVKVAWTGDITAFYLRSSYLQIRWPCLDAWASLPGDTASIATTELGIPGVMAPDKSIIDLSGLQSNDIALGRLSRLQVVLDDKVDLVYLPAEQYYPDMRQELLSSPEFMQDYDIFYQGITEQSDVAVRKDSPYAAVLEQCLAKEIPSGGQEYPPIQFRYYVTLPYPLTLAVQ